MEEQKQTDFNQETQNQAQNNANTASAPKKPSKVNMIISGISIVIIIVAAIVIFSINSGAKITMKEYEQIQPGMTYAEVVDIIGGEGELGSSGFNVEIYTWEGKGVAGANALITFQDGKVVSKAQAGLI